MKTILISPYAAPLRNGDPLHPKNYPHWEELISLLKDYNIIQIGSSKDNAIKNITDFRQNLKFTEIRDLTNQCDTWISVDSFLQHLCAYYKCKPGVVLWGQSNPKIFGYRHNINLLKGGKYLRDKQFWWWEQCPYKPEAFVSAEEVYKVVQSELNK